MREIKFNAWVPKLGIMLENVTLYPDGMMGIYSDDFEEALPEKYILTDDAVYYEDTEKDIFELIMTILPGEDWIWLEEGEFEPLQFTGLTDKNGKEIFEGHVLDFFGIKNIIEFQNGMFCYNVSEKDTDYVPLSNYHFKWVKGKSDYLEIIGNIYQNPELLNP